MKPIRPIQIRHWTHHIRVPHQRLNSLLSMPPSPRRQPRSLTNWKALFPDILASFDDLHEDIFQLILLAAELGHHHRTVHQQLEK